MKSTQRDLVDLFDCVWARFKGRMGELNDEEWAWCPTSDDRISLRWRLAHIADFLAESRNWIWLGIERRSVGGSPEVSTSADALAAVTEAFGAWRALLAHPGLDFSAPIGPAAGSYGRGTRRSFVLHIADELIHHAAEAALLRDLDGGAFARPGR